MSSLLLPVLIVKLLAEIALLALAGQWLLGKLIGARREHNLMYQLLHMLTRPARALAQGLIPRRWSIGASEAQRSGLAALLCLALWLLATLAKLRWCLPLGSAACH